LGEYTWDRLAAALDDVAGQILGTRVQMTPGRVLAVFYTARVKQRTAALTALFSDGYYDSAAPLVRVAYEDWISCAWRLGPGRGTDGPQVLEELGPSYAKIYRRFEALCGRRAVRAEFNPPPDYAVPYLRLKGDPPYEARDWRAKADDLGLGVLHDFVYNYLSELAHGSFHLLGEHLEVEGERYSERQVRRDPDRELLFAFWAFWFELRVLTSNTFPTAC
jgi:hypothetical protein